MKRKKAHLCFVGNMLGRNRGYVTTQGQVVADMLAAEGFQVTCVSSKINRFARLAHIITTIIRSHRDIDVLVLEVYSGLGLIIADVAGWLGKMFKLPTIMVLHGGHLPEFIGRYGSWTKRVLDRADFLVAPSAFLAEKIGAFGYEITQIPNVINLDDYSFKERNCIEPRLIWMRSFHPIYNPEMAIRVLAELTPSFPRATLTMAGVDKGLEDRIKRMVKEAGLSDAIRFPGFLGPAEKACEFAAADIYLNTNRIDNMPVSVVEACAYGLPVVATRVGGLPYLIRHGENGFLVPNEDVAAMTEAVKELIENPDLTRSISLAARRLAERSAWKRVRDNWEELFRRALRPKSAVSEQASREDNLTAEKLKV
ncbi:MAG: glycosyltransferase family 4 protein [Acidobacteria bacterium]|nr:glycosyltransferase family 4 protein [Acidobacteriota bacterium]